MTIYRNIQIKSNDIDLLCKLLHPYKERIEKQNKKLQERVYAIAPILHLKNKPPIMLLVSSDDYVTLIADDGIMNSQLALELSMFLNCPCLHVEFFDYEFYQIMTYCDGKLLTTLRMESKALHNGSLDLMTYQENLNMSDEQLFQLKNALKESDLFESFLKLEYAFNAGLVSDYDRTDKKEVEELERLGVKVYCV